MTPWIGYFFQWDQEFAEGNLLPLLDWQRDPIVAQQTWSVLLNYNRGTSSDLEVQLLPYYRQFAERVSLMLKDAAEKADQFDAHALQKLGHCLAALSMQVIPDPVESGFFRDFLPLLPDEVRGAVARGMDDQLKKMDDADRQRLWSTWLKRYVDLRLVGVPVALSTLETKHMLEWCLHLGPAFAEAVDRIVQMPQESVFAFSIFKELVTKPSVDSSPIHACRLAIAALRAEDYPHFHEELRILHQKIKNSIRGTSELDEYEELLYLRGWEKK